MSNVVRVANIALAMGMVVAPARAQQHIASAVQAMEHQRAQMLADDRQRKMLADADQLLAMALQLKSAVDQARKDELSVQVIKQADQIEKLAKSVKDRMRQ